MLSKRHLTSNERRRKKLSLKWKLVIEQNASSAALILLVKKRLKRNQMEVQFQTFPHDLIPGMDMSLLRHHRQMEARLHLLDAPRIQSLKRFRWLLR